MDQFQHLLRRVRFAHQSSSIEPTILTNRLASLQQRQEFEPVQTPDDDDDDTNEGCKHSAPENFHQKTTHSQ